MTTSSLISSTSRPLRLRQRADLDVHVQEYEGRRYWVVKDPLTLRYFRFQEEEYALLSALDGQISLDQLQQQFQRKFAPQKISTSELHQFIGVLYRTSLVISDSPGQAAPLIERSGQRAAQERRETWGNPLAIKFRGFNPDAVLTWLDDHLGWLFTPTAICLALLMGAAALLLLFVEFDTFRARLPGFHEFFTWKNWFWLSLTLAITKVLHEFGHGLACKRLGGECHEMGAMLLVFSPCLYCNVSDAWTLPNRWHRAGIAAAGMYVELILASLATFVWWSTRPGLVHYLALDVMFVCSVSTLLFNANPLLKFDGYYILSDLLEIPNLRTKASRLLQVRLGQLCLGLPAPHDPFLPQQRQTLFAAYAVGAACYGWLVSASILWSLYHLLEPYGLQIVGQIFALAVLYGLIVRPLWQVVSFVSQPARVERVNKPRAFVSACVLLALLVGVAWLPLPHYVTCSVLIESRAATSVYVDVAGNVREVLAEPFSNVQLGQPLLRLENIDLELAVARLTAEREQMATRLEALRERAFVDDQAAEFLAHTEESLAALDEQLTRKQADLARLTIVAPAEGVLTPAVSVKPEQSRERLANWSGHPLEVRNVGAFLSTGVVVGQIGQPREVVAMLTVDEQDIDFVRTGLTVDVLLDELPGERLRTSLSTISSRELTIAPAALSRKTGGELETRTDKAGQERPAHTTYQASAPLANDAGRLIAGARGRARILVGNETLGQRCYREFCRTLAWDM